MNGTCTPSGRSAMASPPRIGRSSFRALAIGHSSCPIGRPSGQYRRHVTQGLPPLCYGWPGDTSKFVSAVTQITFDAARYCLAPLEDFRLKTLAIELNVICPRQQPLAVQRI